MHRIGLLGIALFALIFESRETYAQFYDGSNNEFGKNRVQYREFLWKQYRFKEFDTYFYEGGQDLAEFTSKVAQKNVYEMEDFFDFRIDDKIQFIVYNNQTDFKQSNIGLNAENQLNIGGTTRIVGSKVFVYFEGDYVSFERQIKDGIARVLINSILYGGNWRDVIKSSTLLNLPEWYVEGLILYASGNVEPDAESKIRSGILTGDYEKFNRLQGRDAHISGYALWRYVAEVYGDNVLPNILYMSRVSRNVESGFLFVLGKSLDTITQEFIAYYRGEYALQELSKQPANLEELDIKTKNNRVYTQFDISPDGEYAIYSSNIKGQYRVYLYNTTTGKRKKLLKAEHKLNRITDYSFPVFAWHPSGKVVSYIQEWRDRLILITYNIDDKKETRRELFQLDKVLSMDYSPNGQQMAFSGVKNGQTDIYLYYTIGNRQENLTNDLYGDFDPSFSKDGNRVLFTSNRPDDTLRTKAPLTTVYENRDVFAFNLKTRSPYLERITDTPNIIEYDPFQYDSDRYTFRANYEGTMNRYIATTDSAISRIDTTVHYRYYTVAKAITNYQSDLLNYRAHPETGTYATMTYADDGYKFFRGNFRNDDTEGGLSIGGGKTKDGDDPGPGTGDGESQTQEVETLETIRLDDEPVKEDEDRSRIDIDNYQFEGEKDFEYQRETIQITEQTEKEDAVEVQDEQGVSNLDSITLPGARNYNLNFTTEEVQLQVDNSYGMNFYQNLSGAGTLNPGLSGLMRYSAIDLFEDYKIEGGFRQAANFDNNTVMLMGEDLSKRMDKRLMLMRFQERVGFEYAGGTGIAEVITYSVNYRMSFPINEVFSLRGTGMYRHDRTAALSTDRATAAGPIVNENFVGLKAEVVFDNTLPLALNLNQGMRWKVWAEFYKDPINFGTDFATIGLDFRHYTKIHRNLIWANRLGWSTSLGSEKLAFFLGGVDNWFMPKVDNSLPLDPEQNYQYQTRGSPVRGFFANARNGNSFGVINSEIRWPVFSYLFDKPLKSDFLQNFQIIAFGDVGSAWTGTHPYSEENSFNNSTRQVGNLMIEIKNNRDPVVYGYGVGLRTRLFGYFVRADWAWGVDDGVVLDNVFYFSLALDF